MAVKNAGASRRDEERSEIPWRKKLIDARAALNQEEMMLSRKKEEEV